MNKVVNAILILIIVSVGLSTCDMCIGYKMNRSVSNIFTPDDKKYCYHNDMDDDTEILNSYLYNNFSDDQRDVYDAIYNALIGFKSTVYIRHLNDADDIFDIVKAVLSEHPEIFWSVGDCSYSATGFLNLNYVYSKHDAMEKKKLLDAKTDEILSHISGDEYTKALAIYDYIILNTSYDFENVKRLQEVPTDSTIEGVLLNNTAVCAGYAKTYQFLLQKAGLSALYVIGTGSNRFLTEGHGWVIQQIDGKYYYTDPTWGDPNQEKLVSHAYFCITASEIGVNHDLDDVYPLLTANSLEANFFVREKRYFDEYSIADVEQLVQESIDRDMDYVEFRYKTPEVYEQARHSLFSEGEIYQVLIPEELSKHSIQEENMTMMHDDINRVIMLIYNKAE